MKKWKNTLVLLLALVLLAMGALIPWLVTRIQDGWNKGKLEYAGLESLELTLKEDRAELTVLEKIDLLLGGTAVEITEDDARMTTADAMQAAMEALRPYQDAGLIPEELDNDYLKCCAMLNYDEQDPRSYNILWMLDLSWDADTGDWLTAIMDDETGKFLGVEYRRPPDLEQSLEELYAGLDILGAVYLNELGLEPDAQSTVENDYYETTTPQMWCEFQTPEGIISIGMHYSIDGFSVAPVILD